VLHQAIIEFVAVTTRPLADGQSLLTPEDARREAEEFLVQFEVLYPTEGVIRTALRGCCGLSVLMVRRSFMGLCRIL
jgi:hypothetical protein